MALDHRRLELKTGVQQAIDLPGLAAAAVSAIVFDYEALLQERTDSKPPQPSQPLTAWAGNVAAAQPPPRR